MRPTLMIDGLLAPWLVGWWMAGLAGLKMWAAVTGSRPQPQRPRLRLIAEDGRLVG